MFPGRAGRKAPGVWWSGTARLVRAGVAAPAGGGGPGDEAGGVTRKGCAARPFFAVNVRFSRPVSRIGARKGPPKPIRRTRWRMDEEERRAVIRDSRSAGVGALLFALLLVGARRAEATAPLS